MSGLALRPLVLASASATRAAMLRHAGLDVSCESAGVDESAVKCSFRREGLAAASCAAALAEAKARRVSQRRAESLVVGADQMLVCGDDWLDKPEDMAAARAQLLQLSGKRHELVTAACVAQNDAVLWHTVERAFLLMRPFDAAFADAYLQAAGEQALSSVGAYQLEGLGAQLFQRVEGDYFAILGLPLLPLLDFLRGRGVVPS